MIKPINSVNQMIFKVFFRVYKGIPNSKDYNTSISCKVIAVENGQQLETRIDNVISNLKADGYDRVVVDNCFNISDSTNQQI